MQKAQEGKCDIEGSQAFKKLQWQCVWTTLSERNVRTEEDKWQITKGFVKHVINFEFYLKGPKYRSKSYQVFIFRNSFQQQYRELITVRKFWMSRKLQ